MCVASIYMRVFALCAVRLLELGSHNAFLTRAGDEARGGHAEC